MKYILAFFLYVATATAYGQSSDENPQCKLTLSEAKIKLSLQHLDDEIAFNVIHSTYYPSVPKENLAAGFCYKLPQPKQTKNLNSVDRWRYESCQSEAAKAPTVQGISAGLKVCREKFDQ